MNLLTVKQVMVNNILLTNKTNHFSAEHQPSETGPSRIWPVSWISTHPL